MPPSLEDVQAIIDGYAEIINLLASGNQMLVNDNGKMLLLEFNAEASIIAGKDIVGNVVILQGKARWK